MAYSEAMGQMHRDDPDDLEAAAFYALSLMRSVRRGEGSIRQDMQAGSIAQAVFRENPDHPGAAHYVIHAFDDPVHAPVALYAALKYADIAPAAVHALHMPSHIFVHLGMWDYLAASNRASWAASVERVNRSFHALYWLHYAYLQQGLYDKAEECLDEIRAVTALPDVRPGTEATQAIMEARQTLATRQWQVPSDLEQLVERILDDPSEVRSHAAGAVLLTAGISAARLGDIAAAELAEQGAREVHEYLDAMGPREPERDASRRHAQGNRSHGPAGQGRLGCRRAASAGRHRDRGNHGPAVWPAGRITDGWTDQAVT